MPCEGLQTLSRRSRPDLRRAVIGTSDRLRAFWREHRRTHLSAMPCEGLQALPDTADQIFAELSTERVSTSGPSGENTADITLLRWPVRACKHSPDAVDHIFAEPSCEAVRARSPTEENTEDITAPRWPVKVCKHSPDAEDRIFACRDGR